MIEVVTVMVILAILAAVGVTNTKGFTDRAKQSARESVARTIFMAGQTALTHAYNQDRDFYMNNRSPIIPNGNFLPTGEAEKLTHNPPALVYLKMDKGANNGTLPLYEMLSPYMNDKAVLNESILIEYNRETGKMLSAFYSDEADVTLGYGSGGSYDVRNRADSALKEGKVGYYGVNSTGEVIRPEQLKEEDYSVLLVDHTDPTQLGYGLLTAEIKIKASVWNSNTVNTMHFNLSLLPMGPGEVESLTFTKDLSGSEYDFRAVDLPRADLTDSIDGAITNPRVITAGGASRSIPIYLKDYNAVSGYCTIVVIIDGVQSIDSTATSIGIRDTFPGLQGGFLYAELEAVNNSDSVSVYSDDKSTLAVHTLYGSDSSADDSHLTVMSVRHLNNIRYNAAASFEQTQSIYMWDYKGNTVGGEGHPLNFTPLCNRLDPVATGNTLHGFAGSYTSNATYAIFDFKSDLTVQPGIPHDLSLRDTDGKTLLDAGLFDTVLSGGSVSNVRFAVSQPINGKPTLLTYFADSDIHPASKAIALVKGVRTAGGIAAVNSGTIENCTMQGYVSAKYEDEISDGVAGAIVGNNIGEISRCASVCTVHGEKFVGGIAGASSGSVRYCEAGTASWRTWSGANGGNELFRAGTPAYGASDTQNGIYRGGYETANNTHRLIIMNSNGAVGGIVGYAREGASVIGCVNACKVESGNIAGSNENNTTGNIAGGIVGQLAVSDINNTAVGYCYNAGEVDAASRGSDVNASGGAGGIVGEVVKGKISSCYNTGTVNLQTMALQYEYEEQPYYVIERTLNLYNNPPDSSGGLIGHGYNETVIDNCYSAQYAGNAYGGAFGELGTGARVEKCGFLGNVRNTQELYYTGQYDEHNDPIMRADGITVYDPETLRKAPSDTNLSDVFANGSFGNPAGIFKYKYPYLARVINEGNLPGHRTPYSPTIARYGDISLEGSMKENDFMYCSFYIAPPEGYINVYAASAYTTNPQFLCCIPLFDKKGFNSLTDVRSTADTSWADLVAQKGGYIYGYDVTYDDLIHMSSEDLKNLQPAYTFRIKAHKLNAFQEHEDKYVAMGYTHLYTIRMVYGTEDPQGLFESHISSTDYTYIRTDLYNTADGIRNNRNCVDTDEIGRGYLWMTNPVPNTPTFLNITSRALVISGMPLDVNKSIILELDYADHAVPLQTVYLDADQLFSTNTPSSFAEAMESSRHYPFAPGPVNPAAHSEGFKYYVQKNDDGTIALYLLLWIARSPTVLPPEKYNGLYMISGNDPVVITVRQGRTQGQPRFICESTFFSWE